MVDMHDTLLAQHSVLGAVLIQPELFGEVQSKVQASDFLDGKCRLVYQTLRKLFISGEPLDPVTLVHRLSGGEEGGGWSGFIRELMETTPTCANLPEYIDVLKEQARVARLNELGGLLQVTNDLDTAREYIGKANALLCDRPGVKIVTLAQGIADFLAEVDRPRSYMQWGIEGLDEQLYAEKGDFVILGGRPSAGKTALSIAFALHMAKTHRVGFFSLETGKRKFFDRLVSHLAKIDMAKIKRSELDEGDYESVAIMGKRTADNHLEFIEAAGFTVEDIRAISLSQRYDVIFLDYIQLVRPSGGGNRTEAVSNISMGLHEFSRSTGTMVVGLSQLSRPEKVPSSGTRAPKMSSLRESGQLEQDADVIMLLYLEDENDEAGPRVLKVEKNKEGTRGRIRLNFDGATQTFAKCYSAPKRQCREPEPKQVTFRDLPNEPVPFEEVP